MKNLNITKQVFLLLLMIIGGGSLKAQFEFAPVGAEWHYNYNSFWVTGYTHVRSETDTVIDGINCNKLVKSRLLYNSITQDSMFYTFGYEYMTQINDSVMIYRYGKLRKLYDFGSEIGDTITFPGTDDSMTISELMYGKAIIVDKGVVNVDGNDLRYIDIEPINESPWIFSSYGFDIYNPYISRICEKIGNMYGFLLPEVAYEADNEEGGALRCYSDNQGIISLFDKECDYIGTTSINESYTKEIEIYPNPTEGKVTIESIYNYNSITIYDAYGRSIYSSHTNSTRSDIDMSNYPSGLYVISITNETDCYKELIIKK